MRTFIWEWGFFGFGRLKKDAQGNLFPCVCCGVGRMSWCRSLLSDAIKRAVGL